MYKKAGLIIGVLIILVALGLNWFFNKDGKEVSEIDIKQPNQTKVEEPVKQPVVQQPIEQPQQVVQQPVVETTPQQVQNEPQQVVTKSSLTEVDLTQLGNPVKEETEVVIISKKRVILLDSSPNSSSNKQLAYSLDLITGSNNQLNHFVSANTYEAFNVGDKLKLTYNVYRNVNGVEFPTIKSVELVQ